MRITTGTIYQGILDHMHDLFGAAMTGFTIPTLYYSDAKPQVVTYGDLEEDALAGKFDELRKKYRKNHPSEDIIDALTCDEAVTLLCDASLLRQYMPKKWKGEIPIWLWRLIEEVKGLLARELVRLEFNADYDAAKNRITILTKPMEDDEDPARQEAAFRTVMAHEMFHAFHHYTAPETYSEYSYEAEIVREALAEFYVYLFNLNEQAAATDGIDPADSDNWAKKRYVFWRTYLFTNIPQPNGIFCMNEKGTLRYDTTYADCVANKAVERFLHILELSRTDMHQAYLELVPEAYRKQPLERYRTGGGRRVTVRGQGKVSDIGFAVEDELNREAWDAIGAMIRHFDIGSLEELQELVPPDVLQVERGRFITLASGEILGAYPQWRIGNRKRFMEIAESAGFIFSRDFACHTVVTVRQTPGIERTYLYDPEDEQGIEIGETVIGRNREGEATAGTVTAVTYMDDAELGDFCENIGRPGVSVAKRGVGYADDQIVRFRCTLDGGFFTENAPECDIEVDRRTHQVEVSTWEDSPFCKEGTMMHAPDSQVEEFFRELEQANWEDAPFGTPADEDAPTWHARLIYGDEKWDGASGTVGGGPENGATIRRLMTELLDETTKELIFGTE